MAAKANFTAATESAATHLTKDLESAATTNAQSLRILRAILGLESVETTSDVARSKSTTTAKPSRPQSKTAKRVVVPKARRGKTDFDIYEEPRPSVPRLSDKEKRKFATEAFNVSLKSLSKAIKEIQAGTYQTTQKDTKAPGIPPRRTKPLQPSSANPQNVKGSADTQTGEENIVTLARCASSTLQSLRRHSGDALKDENSLRREQGALVFLDKLITLGHLKLALEETEAIRCQYEAQYQQSGVPSSEELRKSRLELGDMLVMDKDPKNSEQFFFVTTFQGQALRLAILQDSTLTYESFVESVKLDKIGGPAERILYGYRKEWINANKAGEQLRTISQALFKIISRSQSKLKGTFSLALNLRICVEALCIRVKSWELLNHRPDINREVWTMLLQSLKFLWKRLEGPDDKCYDLSKAAIEKVGKFLQGSGYQHALSEDIKNFFYDLAEMNSQTDDIRMYFNSTTSEQKNQQQFLHYWKLATTELSKAADDGPRTGDAQCALDSFDSMPGIDATNAKDFIVFGVWLRNACSNAISMIEQLILKKSAGEGHIAVQGCAIRILFALSDLLFHNLQSLTAENMSTSGDTQKNSSSIVTMLAKTVEATLEAEKCGLSRSGTLQTECCTALERCSSILQHLLGLPHKTSEISNLLTHCETLCVRLSNAYWLRYVNTLSAETDSSHASLLLEQSIETVTSVSTEKKQQAVLGLKLEKLAQLFDNAGKLNAALDTYTQAVEYYIQAGALTDAVETAIKSQSKLIWADDKTMAFQLERMLRSRVNISTQKADLDESQACLYDKDTLPDLHRCLLLEIQLRSVSGRITSNKTKDEISKALFLVFDLCSSSEQAVYRLRLISNLLTKATQTRDLPWLETISEKLVQDACAKVLSKKGAYLLSFEGILRCSVRLQWFLISKSKDLELARGLINDLSQELTEVSNTQALHTKVDDIDSLLDTLSAFCDFARTNECHSLMISSLKAVVHVLRLHTEKPDLLFSSLLRLANILNAGDKTLEAGRYLTEVSNLVDTDIPSHLQLNLALSKIEYYLNLSNLDKCNEILEQASEQHALITAKKPISGKARLEQDSILALASLLASEVAFRQGRLPDASVLARQSVKLTTSISSQLESTHRKLSGDHLVNSMSSLTLEAASKRAKLGESLYRDHIELHIRALSNMGFVSMHHGLYSDAQFYYEQARKMSGLVNSSKWTSRLGSVLSLIHASAGQHEKATEILKQGDDSPPTMYTSTDLFYHLHRAGAFLELANIKAARQCLELIPKQEPQSGSDQEETRSQVPAKQSPKARRTGPKPRSIQGAARRPTMKQAQNNKRTEMTQTRAPLLFTYRQLEVEDYRAAIIGLLSVLSNTSDAVKYDQSVDGTNVVQLGNLVQRDVTKAVTTLAQALSQLSGDSVTSVLSETAIALPVKYKSNRKSGRVSLLQSGVPQNVKGKGTASESSDSVQMAQKLLADAHNTVHSIRTSKGSFCSSMVMHLLHNLQSKIALLSSTMKTPFSYSSTQLVLQSLMPKEVAQRRERLAILAESSTKDRSQIQSWLPAIAGHVQTQVLMDEHIFDQIPDTWSIVSLSLTDDHRELLMSKTKKGRSPFLLRVPLSRSDDIDEEEDFSFIEAKDEIFRIIEEANRSAHDKRGQADKETRKLWYSEREKLDKTLEAWLLNVENIWLGGFRGLFTAYRFDETSVARFGQALSHALNTHLPSRQKSANTKIAKVELHAHVLELFLGLGSPQTQEIDDAVMDLLYFVVDILQFSGEQNAYDEVDWDAMLVDVLDALAAAHVKMSTEQLEARHTILILDKELQSFPWESLPCLRQQPVSRMPSLGAIFDRLKQIRSQDAELDGYVVSGTSSGAYILNPSSDLTSTQTTFEPILQKHMRKYTSLINKPPSEDQFASLLTSHELLLYFGHGSGAQYIRGRTIRRLEKCAVTLLMGCSSAKMTECGKFESYGMPGYYSLGGSMAVVGTLWDVTDRDIDRFAMSTMAEWGLVPYEDEHVQEVLAKSATKNKTSSKGKGKVTAKSSSARDGARQNDQKRSLDLAVMKGRDACLLKYLNGAAPVIYGLPVYLG